MNAGKLRLDEQLASLWTVPHQGVVELLTAAQALRHHRLYGVPAAVVEQLIIFSGRVAGSRRNAVNPAVSSCVFLSQGRGG
jgi:hypothetical protein